MQLHMLHGLWNNQAPVAHVTGNAQRQTPQQACCCVYRRAASEEVLQKSTASEEARAPQALQAFCCRALWGGSALAATDMPGVFRPSLSVGMLVHRLAAGRDALHKSATAKEAEAAPALAQDALQGLVDNLSAAGADAAEARARKILLGLGFSTRQMGAPVSRLSGEDR